MWDAISASVAVGLSGAYAGCARASLGVAMRTKGGSFTRSSADFDHGGGSLERLRVRCRWPCG
eukprot:9483148-Pyramimonas_sp.AAC.1